MRVSGLVLSANGTAGDKKCATRLVTLTFAFAFYLNRLVVHSASVLPKDLFN